MPVTSVHVTNAWHSTSGGIRTFYRALLAGAERAGRRVVLVVPGARDEVQELGPHGCVHVLAAPRAPAFDRRYRLLYPPRYLPWTGRALHRILRRERPDVVEICDKYALPYLAALLRKRLLAGVPRPRLLVGLSCERFDDNMAAYVTAGRLARRFTGWYIRHVYGPPFDVHLTNSEYTAGELRRALHDRDAEFVQVCPMGVDLEAFSPARRSEETRQCLLEALGLDRRGRVVLYAGRISPEKNLPLLVESFGRLAAGPWGDRVGLVVAGDGPLAASLERAAAQRFGRRVRFCGNLTRDALAVHYASADVFVHPNPREPFGIGPLEAMASGTPVVLPGAGGVLTYATAANAWLAEPAPGTFADAMASALEGDPARVAAALDTTRRFAWPAIADRYFALQDRLLASPPSLARRRRYATVTEPPYPCRTGGLSSGQHARGHTTASSHRRSDDAHIQRHRLRT